MKKFFIKLSKVLLEIAIVILVLLAVLWGIARSLFPYVDRYRPYFETWASQAVHQPIKIGKIEASWKGLHPVFSLDDLTVFNQSKTINLLKIKHVEIQVNMLASLMNRRLIPSSYEVLGTHLTIHQIDNNTLDVNGIKVSLGAFQSNANSTNDIQETLKWLSNQGQITLEEVDVDWYTQHGMLIPITRLKLKLSQGIFKRERELIGLGHLVAKIPNHFRFVINMYPDTEHHAEVAAKIYFHITHLNIQPWIHGRKFAGFSVNQGQLQDLRFWGDWNNQQLQHMQTVFLLDHAQLEDTMIREKVSLDKFAGNMVWRRGEHGWDLAADQVQLGINNAKWPLTQFDVHTQYPNPGHTHQIIRADLLNVSQINQLLFASTLLSDRLKNPLYSMQPQGLLKDVVVHYRKEDEHKAFSANLAFQDIKVLPWKKLPGVEHLSGALQMTPAHGHLKLEGQGLLLNFAKLFQHPIFLNDYVASLQWKRTEDGWKIELRDGQMQNSHMSLRADSEILLPKGGDPFVQLLASFSEKDITHVKDYIPQEKINPNLALWLKKALVSGEGVEGALLLHGPLSHFPFNNHTGRFEVLAQTKHVNFHYADQWPDLTDLSADLKFDGSSLKIDAPSAKIFGKSTHPIQAEISDLRRAELKLQSSLDADAADGMRFIRESPLRKTLGEDFAALNLKGPIKLGLFLDMPFYAGGGSTKVVGDVSFLPYNTLTLPDWNMVLNQLQGGLRFTEKSVASNNLRGKWLNQDIALSIQTKNAAGGNITQVQASGLMTVDALQKAYGSNFLTSIASGGAAYSVLLDLSKNNPPRLLFTSDLDGLGLDLPEPLKKAASGKRFTQIQIVSTQEKLTNIIAKYADILNAALTFQSNQAKSWTFRSGELRFGNAAARLQTAPGLLIDGKLSRLVLSEIQDYISAHFPKGNKASAAMPNISLNKVDLNIGRLEAFGLNLDSARVQAQSQQNAWLLQINSPNAIGRLSIPKDLSRQPIRADFQRFNYTPNASKAISNIRPAQIPALNIVVRDFYYNRKPFGQVTLFTSPQKTGLRIDRFSLAFPNFVLFARGQWQENASGRQQTTLSGNFRTSSMGRVLASWQVTKNLVNTNGSAAFALSWPGPAYSPDFKNLDGNFSFGFKSGRIINIEKGQTGMGIGKILTLLSLQTLPRRLTLDFSDLFKSGFSFDSLQGSFAVMKGNAMTNNSVMDGPVAKVELKGRIGLAAKDYDLNMTVTPYLTSSLPMAATLVGGPAAGAAAWVANKIFGNVVNQMTSHRYHVSGSWANPIVTE